MGTPSILNANVNANMPLAIAERLDEMNVAYLLQFQTLRLTIVRWFALLVFRASLSMPTLLVSMLDYNSSQDAADWITAFETGTNPVLRNEQAYNTLQTNSAWYLCRNSLRLRHGLKSLMFFSLLLMSFRKRRELSPLQNLGSNIC